MQAIVWPPNLGGYALAFNPTLQTNEIRSSLTYCWHGMIDLLVHSHAIIEKERPIS
jgi:hypothetical protein